MDKRHDFRRLRSVIALAVLAAVVVSAGAAPRTERGRRQSRIGQDDRAEARWVEETLKGLTLRERVGQMVMTPVQVGASVVAGRHQFIRGALGLRRRAGTEERERGQGEGDDEEQGGGVRLLFDNGCRLRG